MNYSDEELEAIEGPNWEFSFPILDKTVEATKEWILETIRRSGITENVSLTYSYEEWAIKVVVYDLRSYKSIYCLIKCSWMIIREVFLKVKWL